MRPPHTQIVIFHNEPPFHSCIYYRATGDEYQKFKLIISSSTSGLLRSVYHTEPHCKEKYVRRPQVGLVKHFSPVRIRGAKPLRIVVKTK